MSIPKRRENSGLIGLVIVLVFGIVILSLFSISFSDIMNSSEMHWIFEQGKIVWDNYLYPAGGFIWNKIIVGFVWTHMAAFFGVHSGVDLNTAATSTADMIASSTKLLQ